uniref:C3H1-type domain-containing protein n=1 Tax=Plectus sambesii TaxID=2011161 RepID=A0A914WE81_9BILA
MPGLVTRRQGADGWGSGGDGDGGGGSGRRRAAGARRSSVPIGSHASSRLSARLLARAVRYSFVPSPLSRRPIITTSIAASATTSAHARLAPRPSRSNSLSPLLSPQCFVFGARRRARRLVGGTKLRPPRGPVGAPFSAAGGAVGAFELACDGRFHAFSLGARLRPAAWNSPSPSCAISRRDKYALRACERARSRSRARKSRYLLDRGLIESSLPAATVTAAAALLVRGGRLLSREPAALVTDANMLGSRTPPFSQQDPVRSWLLCSQPSAFLCPPGDLNASSLTGAPLKQMMPQFGRADSTEQRRRGQPKNPKLYKTELCRSWMDYGRCNYGDRCQYAHGQDEKRPIPRHPKYKTEYCQSFHNAGYCPYGPRCHFIHTEKEHLEAMVAAGATPAQIEQAKQHHATNNPNKPALVVIPTGYGSAGESPVPSSAGSGSDSPTSGSFSPGLSSSDSTDDVFTGATSCNVYRRPQSAFQWPMPGDAVDSMSWDMQNVQLQSSEPTTPTHAQAGRLPVFARLSNGGN